MMVKRTDGQLIYTVQFHLEKSFEDWNKNRTRWEHPNDSRDGRILFENFPDQLAARELRPLTQKTLALAARELAARDRDAGWNPRQSRRSADSGDAPRDSQHSFTSFSNNRCR